MTTDAEIIQLITEALLGMVRGHYGPEANLLPGDPVRRDRQWSTFLVYQAEVPGRGEVPLIVKIPRDAWMVSLVETAASEHLRNYARREAEMLQRISRAVEAASVEGLTSIPALGGLSDAAGTVMELVDFQTLKQLSLKYFKIPFRGRVSDDLLEHAARAGSWLRIFHQTSVQPDLKKLGETDLPARVEEALSNLAAEAAGAEVASLRARFQARLEELKERPVQVVELHDDFHFNNIFITSEGETGGYDPSFGTFGPVYEDLSHFVTDPALWWQQVFSGGSLVRRWCHTALEEAFLGGYGEEIDREVLGVYCALQVVLRWQLLAERVMSSGKLGPVGVRKALMRMVRGWYLRLINSYLVEVSGS